MDETEENLEELYIRQGLSLREIAKIYGYSCHKTVAKRLRKFGIPVRNKSEAYTNAVENGKEPASFKKGYTPWNLGQEWDDEYKEAQSKRIKKALSNPDVRLKISRALKGKKKSDEHRRNISKGRKGIKFTKQHRENIRKATLKQKPLYRNTSIEVLVQEALKARDLGFKTHVCVAGICRPDIVFPKHRLAVFCDGMYWHNKPEVAARDRRQEKQLKSAGWEYLRFTGEQIRESSDTCADRIIEHIKGAST